MNNQIEEMAKIIDYQPIIPICLERDKCAECQYSKYDDRCKRMRIAEALYNAGYTQRANVDKEEYERQLRRYRNLEINYEAVYEAYMQALTDIAQDILQAVVLLATEMENEDFMSIDAENAIARLNYQIQEHFKTKYGVEVKR